MATHNWPGTSASMRLVPKGDAEYEAEIAANRSEFEDTMPRMRLAPLRRQRILIGGGWRRKLPGMLRELVPLLAVLGALVVIGWWWAS